MASLEPLRIFSKEEWKTLYPDTDSQAQRGKTYPFHFMTARNPKEEILIERIRKATDALIAADDEDHHKLTPLIIAVMKGNTRIVEELLLKEIVRAHINDTDAYGWTPLHHAALTSDEIFQKLRACGANPNCRTILNASTDDLKALVAWGIKARSLEHVSFEEKPLEEETAKTQFKMTSYRDLPYFPPEQLQHLWQQKKFQEEPLANYVIIRFKHHAPKLVISAIDKERGFYGLSAGEELPIGTVIGEYGGAFREQTTGFGTFSSEEAKKHAYLFKGFDAKEVGNATRFMNCGFSNVAPLPKVENGVVKVFFVAHQPIQKGEPILYNYGGKAYDVTFGPQTLFNRDKMHAFFKKGLEAIRKENELVDEQILSSKTMDQAVDLYLKRANLRDHAVFPLDNPLALIDLHISGTVPAKAWLKALVNLDHLSIQEWVKQQGLMAYARAWQFTLYLSKIDRNIQTNAKEHYPLFQKWVQDRCQTAKIMDLLKGMELIEEALVVQKNPKMLEEVDERLKHYDWKQDPSSLFSYESRRRALEQYLDFTLFRGLDTQTLLHFPTKRNAFIEILETEAIKETRGLKSGFKGSEMEQIFKEIKESTPKASNLISYLTKIGEEFKEMGNFIK